MKKAVVTVLGQDKVGITAKICGVLAETNINILDISQMKQPKSCMQSGKSLG